MGVKLIRSDMTCTIRWKIFGQWPMATMVPAILYRKRQRWQEIVSEARTLAEDWFEYSISFLQMVYLLRLINIVSSQGWSETEVRSLFDDFSQTPDRPIFSCQWKLAKTKYRWQLSNISAWPTNRDRRKIEWKQMQIIIELKLFETNIGNILWWPPDR